MDTSDQFKVAEDEYQRLKGQLAAGRITQEQFDAAVKALVVQDAQGQAWILGDNGFWAKYNGPVRPRTAPVAPARTPGATQPAAAPPPSAATAPVARSTNVPLLIIVGAGLLAIICLLAVGGLMFARNQSAGAIVVAPTLYPATPTIAFSLAPSAIPVALPTPTLQAASPTIAATVPTPTDSPATATATATASASPSATATASATTSASASPSATATASPSMTATATISPTVAIPSGLFVTGLRLDPPTPARKQDTAFYATFVNGTNTAINTRWVVFIYRPTDLNHSLGETTTNGATIAVGQSEVKTQGWKLTGGGGCEPFVARVATVDEHKKPTLLNKPDGTVFETTFNVC